MSTMLATSATVIEGDHFASRWLLIAPVMGVGVGLCYPLLAAVTVHGLAESQLAAASAINQCARQIGAAVGVAAAVGVLGPAPLPSVSRFHAAWWVAAGFCLVACCTASRISQRRRRRSDASSRTVLEKSV
jgi:MFS family permease